MPIIKPPRRVRPAAARAAPPWHPRARSRRLPPGIAGSRGLVVRTRVFFGHTPRPASTALGEIPPASIANFARAPSGEIFWANGLMPMMKWDGVKTTAQSVGVPAPTTAPVLSSSGSGVLTGTYTAYQRFLDENGNPSNLSPVSDAITVAGVYQIDYANLEVPTDPKVVRKQVLRNTSGQALTYFVDVDTNDTAATTLSSPLADEDLAEREAVPLFDTEGNGLANRFGLPPSDKPVLASYQDRMFAAGEVVYRDGNVMVTNGLTAVFGIGTAWTDALVGRLFAVQGTGVTYTITFVDRAAQALTLDRPYIHATDFFALYAIRSAGAQRRTIFFTEAGHYDAWPAVNGVTVEDNGDVTTGLMAAEGFLFVLQRRHIYRLTFGSSPVKDGGLFLSARRGCVNQRSWVHVEGKAYLLDEKGIYLFEGGGDTQELSAPIQNLFWLDHPAGEPRINWRAQEYFHAVHSRDENVIRWFVALSGLRLPRHALCYNYLARAWWLEEYPAPLGASCLTDDTLARVLAAGPARKVYALGVGTLDGVDGSAGTNYATAQSGGVERLTDTQGDYASGIALVPIGIVAGRGKGQQNLLCEIASGVLRVVRPWRVRPDLTSVFQVGGSRWQWLGGWHRWNPNEGDQQRRIELVFEPCSHPASLDVRLFRNNSLAPEEYGTSLPVTPAEASGVQITAGSPDAVIDLTTVSGYAQVRRSGRRERYVIPGDLLTLEMRGFQSGSPVLVYNLKIEGAVPG